MESLKKTPALFLDRDGVINAEKNYLHKVEDVEFIDGIFELCRKYQEAGYLIIVVTNQSGIARGYYSEEDFAALTNWMSDEFKKHGIVITHVYHCPHHPDISGPCECRKPNPGMLLEAAKVYNIDLKNSLLIGDKERDIEAAARAGVGSRYLLGSAHRATKATRVIDDLKSLL
ncbi:MAG: D-glycero-beta-D-manno-heptose-1,7-bisphosphate 7-phosphatase [Helicobacteraceae bacterium 4484_230]|nr:MAG: D-glycero-beta-D-manno-heptose-1,7-bisphosphate 7-phosphatase [Helicobacteraceae bacterium 4484_230]